MAVRFPQFDNGYLGGSDIWNNDKAGDILIADYFEASASTTGQIKVWDGVSFVAKPVKVWNGSSWVTKPLKRWDGSSWIITNY